MMSSNRVELASNISLSKRLNRWLLEAQPDLFPRRVDLAILVDFDSIQNSKILFLTNVQMGHDSSTFSLTQNNLFFDSFLLYEHEEHALTKIIMIMNMIYIYINDKIILHYEDQH